MVVTVHLHTILQRQTPAGMVDRMEATIADGSTLGELLSQMEIEMPVEQMLLVVNYRMAEPDQPLEHGDVVNLMPAISGGVDGSWG